MAIDIPQVVECCVEQLIDNVDHERALCRLVSPARCDDAPYAELGICRYSWPLLAENQLPDLLGEDVMPRRLQSCTKSLTTEVSPECNPFGVSEMPSKLVPSLIQSTRIGNGTAILNAELWDH